MIGSVPTPLLRCNVPGPGLPFERTNPVNDDLETTALRYEQTAAELELAARHLSTSARHARNRDGMRIAAHAFAASGHVQQAMQELDAPAGLHAARSRSG